MRILGTLRARDRHLGGSWDIAVHEMGTFEDNGNIAVHEVGTLAVHEVQMVVTLRDCLCPRVSQAAT